jgi:hypothetical protein
MRLNEFESLNLAVNFHNELNPKLWENDRLQPKVRAALMRIAEHFKDFLGIEIYDLLDITISGSNAAYTYTSHSDIDLHLVVMIPEDHEPELKELFQAKKYQYNDQHDIKVRGFDVELYVQDAEDAHHSMGIYSVLNDRWIKKPKQQRAQVDDIEVQEKYRSIKHRIDRAIVSDDFSSVQSVWNSVKNMRKSGLETGGEFSSENLAFKILRADGTLDKLKRHLGNLEDAELSIDEATNPPKRQSEVYLDMDGVLCDFFEEYAKLAGNPPDGSGRYNYRNIPAAKTDPTLNKMVGTDFFARLPKFSTADTLVNMVVGVFGHYNICSSPLRGDFENSEKNKRIWIAKHLSPQPRDIIITPRKERHAVQPDGTPNVLIDDRGDNISKWEAAGGVGIKYQADEDGLDTVTRGLKRALKIIAGKKQLVPQKLKSLDRSLPVATQDEPEPLKETVNQSEIAKFIRYVYDKLHIDAALPRIKLQQEKEAPDQHRTGWYNPANNEMWVYTGNRNLIDILRTVAHELAHHKQRLDGDTAANVDLADLEGQADQVAGIIMKLYVRKHPEIIE